MEEQQGARPGGFNFDQAESTGRTRNRQGRKTTTKPTDNGATCSLADTAGAPNLTERESE